MPRGLRLRISDSGSQNLRTSRPQNLKTDLKTDLQNPDGYLKINNILDSRRDAAYRGPED